MIKLNKMLCILLPIFALILSGGVAFFLSTQPQTTAKISSNNQQFFNLLAHWSQGNVAVLIRHAERCDRSSNPCLEPAGQEEENGITVNGKIMAQKLGEHYKALLSRHSTVIYNSPVKRTAQSAKYMFDGLSSDQKWLRNGCKKHLLKNILRQKQQGVNMLMVTHATCMDKLGETDGKKLINMELLNNQTYGISIFIAIDSLNQQAYVLGFLKTEDWEKLKL